uniref:Uncharacterized protein n=1 Tax=candidate division WOR-3 bacterium TaxID=2052148 RepID=A0A7C6EGP4_UNCW3
MDYFILILSFVQLSGDSIVPEQVMVRKSYTKDVIINAGIGLGFGLGAYYCKNTADKAYDEYKTANTMKKTVEQWNRVVLYDKLTVFFGAGSAVFFVRAIYYQLKNVRQTQMGVKMPELDIRYTDNNKLMLGIVKSL